VTVLEGYTTEEQRSVVRSLWTKVLNAKDINNFCYDCRTDWWRPGLTSSVCLII
jgi:hypothetical protein